MVAAAQKITPVTTGAIETHREPVYEIKAYARVFVTLTHDHRLDEKWNTLCDDLERLVQAHLNHHANTHYLAEPFLSRITNLRSRIDRTQRSKRGLFNFIGDVGSFLFGIPSASDIESLTEANSKLVGAVEGVVQVQQQTIAKVNLLGRTQVKIVEKVNDIVQQQTAQNAAISRQYALIGQNAYVARYNNRAIRVMSMLDLIDDHLFSYEESLGQIQAVRTSCEGRIVTEQVLPIEMVKQILAVGDNQAPVTPEAYYAYVKVEKITTLDEQIICILQAPLFSSSTQYLSTIKTFPKCNQEKCLQIHQPDPFILDFETEDLYFPDECHGPIPQACRPGVVYDKTQQPCLHGLINHDPTQQIQCPVTYYATPPPPGAIITTIINRYLITTTKTLYHYKCPRVSPEAGPLKAGTYLIDVDPHCVLDAGQWMIRGLPTVNLNRSLEIYQPKPIPLEWLTMPNDTHIHLDPHLPPGLTKLTVPRYEELLPPKDSDLSQQIDEIQADIGKTPIAWWIWLIVAILAVIILVIIVQCMRRYYCRPSEPGLAVKYHAATETIGPLPLSNSEVECHVSQTL